MSIKRPFEGPFKEVIEKKKFSSKVFLTWQDDLPRPLVWQLWQRNRRPFLCSGQHRPKSLHISENLLKTFTQVLIPLDHDMFWLSRVLRICESLEKHSGVTFKNWNWMWFDVVDISQSIFRSAAHSTLSTLCRDGFPLPRFLPSGYDILDIIHLATTKTMFITTSLLMSTTMMMMMCRCLTTTTGTTRVTKAATTPSPHLAASGTVRHLSSVEQLIRFFKKGVFGTRKTGRHPRAAETREDLQMAATQEKRWASVSTLVILVSWCLVMVSWYLVILLS